MLQYKSVPGNVFNLIKELMSLSCFTNFRLVGGTALALMRGHRYSENIELHSDELIDVDVIKNELLNFLSDRINIEYSSKHKINAQIKLADSNPVQIEIRAFDKYPFTEEYKVIESIKFAEDIDILCALLYKISIRHEKNDFIDIALLLKKNDLIDVFKYYSMRYPKMNKNTVLMGLGEIQSYDENMDEDITSSEISLSDAKIIIKNKLKKYIFHAPHKNNNS